MKTIADIANELNVSKTSIYNILKKSETDLKEHTFKKQGKTFLDEHAEKFLIDYYAVESLETLKDIVIDTENLHSATEQEFESNSTNFNKINADSTKIEMDSNILNIVSILQKQIEIKDEQLERKDTQIKDLTESIVNISLAFSDRDKAKQQELFLQAIDKNELTKNAPPPENELVKKKSFWDLFKK